MKPILAAIIVALTGLGACVSEGAVITFNFTGTDPGQSSPWTQTSELDPNATLQTGFSIGPGLLGSTGDDRFNARNWTVGGTLATAIGNGDYFGFVITPNSGHILNLNSATATFTLQVSGSGPTTYALMSSLGGFADGAELQTGTGIANATSSLLFTFGATGYDDIVGPVEFRIYGYGGTSLAGTMSANAFSLGGTITPVPEPAEWGLICAMGLLGVCGLHSWRERRRALRQSPSAS